jgi:hypothetical protein
MRAAPPTLQTRTTRPGFEVGYRVKPRHFDDWRVGD